MKKIAAEMDELFGFTSTWTFNRGDECWELDGTINIDDDQIDHLVQNSQILPIEKELVTRFLIGHEKGHHLQDVVSPDRNYEIEHHIMEIEADLIGAWALAQRNESISTRRLNDIIKQFDDSNRIAKRLGVVIGDPIERNPHHPWAEQREIALVRGPRLSLDHPGPLDTTSRGNFMHNMHRIASDLRVGRF